MIALERIGHAAAGEKRTAQKGRAAALILKQRKVDMQRIVRPRVIAERFKNDSQLSRVRDAENALAAALRPRVKAEGKRLLKKLRQPGGKVRTLGNDAHLGGGKAARVEQHAVGLGPRTAAPRKRFTAELGLDVGGE